jgi:outer membrane receptor protein involved in Fe transport
MSASYQLPLKLRRLPLVLALNSALFVFPGTALLSYSSSSFAQEKSELGTLYVYGYQAGATTDTYALRVQGKTYQPKQGAVGIRLEEGPVSLELLRDDQLIATLPVYLDKGLNQQLLLTFDKLGAVDYKLQDSKTQEVFDSGTLITPGMESVIRGKVTTEAEGEIKPLVNAVVWLEGTTFYASTDSDGAFSFSDLASGDYALSVQAEGFEAIEPIRFTLAPESSAEHDLSLVLALETLSEIQVSAKGVSQQTMATEEERSSAQVQEVVNAEQMKRAGDSEASGALKRVTGLSVVAGKFVYVRGMGERYSSVLLNGAQIPSPDPTRRVVPLDLFPVDVLDSVVIQKSYSADMPGEFGGGTVQLRTKEAVAKPFFKLSLGASIQDGTSFSKGLRNAGGNRDWLGFDRSRELPSELARLTRNGTLPFSTPPAELEAAGDAVARVKFNTRKENLGPNANFGLSGGWSHSFTEEGRFSLIGAMRHSHQWESNEELRRSYGLDGQREALLLADISREVSERQVALSGLVGASLRLNNNHRFQTTSTVLRQTADQTQIDTGFRDSADAPSQFYELEWTENHLIANQLGGEHLFDGLAGLGLNWQITDARAGRDSPAKRNYTYLLEGTEYRLLLNSSGNQISYENLADKSREYRVTANLPYSVNDSVYLNVSSGFGRVARDRDSSIRRFSFAGNGLDVISNSVRRLTPDEIFSAANIRPNGYVLSETTRSLDSYVADQTLNSAFLNIDASIGEQWRLLAGARREDNSQFVSTFDVSSPATGRQEAKSDEQRWLPAAALTYIFDETQQQLRLSYGRSVSRPDFREFSPAPFLDPVLDIESFGNVNLLPTTIDNLDLRWELYFDGDESISAALFYKDFDKPIERVSAPATGTVLTYENADAARNLGIETEAFMRLGRFTNGLENYFASANIAWIDSKVELGSAGQVSTSRNRPLQGQSKYLINLQMGYKPLAADNPWEATALYNVAGKRIAQLGDFGRAEIFEEPFHQLDFTARYRFDANWNAAFRLRNLLDETVEYTQAGLMTRRFKPGREFGFSMEWTP